MVFWARIVCRWSRIVNCREAIELLGDEVDGSLGLMQRWRLRVHVWMCEHCRNYFGSYKTTLRAERAALGEAPDDLRDGVTEALVESILLAAKGTQRADHPRGDNHEPNPNH
jgi:Putative zinc-finger